MDDPRLTSPCAGERGRELSAVFAAAVAAVRPGPLVAAALAELPVALAARPRYVLAVGKAAYDMLDGARGGGWVQALAVGAPGAPPPSAAAWPGPTELIESSHPLPDERSRHAARRARALVDAAPADALIVALISGGGSAMVAEPRAGLTLREKVERTARVMAAGASIAELNRVRRALSAVKGGLLVADAQAPVLTLAVSDVANDDPRIIASGLTVSETAQPLAVGASWRAVGGRAGDRYRVLAGQGAASLAAAAELSARGWSVERWSTPLTGPVAEVATALARASSSLGPRCALVAHGEPVVALPVQPPGASPAAGGRAQQLALELARRLDGAPVTALVAGTDGVDGPSTPPVAGAVVDGASWRRLSALGHDGAAALARCDARPALSALGALLSPGPTGVNHADLMLLLCDPDRSG